MIDDEQLIADLASEAEGIAREINALIDGRRHGAIMAALMLLMRSAVAKVPKERRAEFTEHLFASLAQALKEP